MSGGKYGPTPPYRQVGTDGGSQLTPGTKGGQYGPEILSSDNAEWQVFSDALQHRIAATDIDADICLSARVTIEAQDTTTQRASVVADIEISRTGGGAVVIGGTPIFLGFTPNAGPWNTIVADCIPVGSQAVIVVTGLAGVPIRWRGFLRIYSAQGKPT